MNKQATEFSRSKRRARFSAVEFARMIETGAFEDMWVELVDGKLERMPPPGREHGNHQIKLLLRLGGLIGEARLFGEVGIDLDDDTVLACDAAILAHEGGSGTLIRADEILLVVEVAETTRDRDLGMKRLRYAAAGIPIYWVIDGDRSVVHVYERPEDGDYKSIAIVKFGEPLAVPGTNATIVLD